jgi:hypothetical protein
MGRCEVSFRFSIIGIFLFVGACSHSVHLVHTSDFAPNFKYDAYELVSVQADQFAVMGFVGNTDYVNVAYQELNNQCQNREITGVTTEYWTSHSFFSWTNKIRMQGYCKKR